MNKSNSMAARFRVETRTPKGQCIVCALEDDPVQAMLKYVEMTRHDFGRKHGIGSYVALTDTQLRLDVARIADGIGTYSTQSRTKEGRAALQMAERQYDFATEAKSIAGELNCLLASFGTGKRHGESSHRGLPSHANIEWEESYSPQF